MNYPAAQELNIEFPFSKNTVAYWKGESAKKLTIKHEKCEATKMLTLSMPYLSAHACCLIATNDLKHLNDEPKGTKTLVRKLQNSKTCEEWHG